MNNSEFEHIIKEKFEGAVSSVPSNAWAGVSSQIGTATGSAGMLSGVLGKVAIGVVSLGFIGVAAVLMFSEDETKQIIVENNTSQTKELVTPVLSEEPIEIISITEDESSVERPEHSVKTPATLTYSNDSETEKETPSIPEETQPTVIPEQATTGDSQKPALEQTNEEPSVSENTSSTTDKEPAIIPSGINSKKLDLSENKFQLTVSSKLPENYLIKWYVNDELMSSSESFSHSFSMEGEHLIMARIYTESVLVNTLYHSIFIDEQPVIVVPNTFTPHSSYGYNDTFDIDLQKSENIAWYEITIFNGFNAILFKSTDAVKNWDGFINGDPAPEAAYYYVIKYKSTNGTIKTDRGTVILQR